jgi:APA family basic amino acid/polyamine antiporter
VQGAQDPRPGAVSGQDAPGWAAGQFGLASATGLITGSIVGVGIFNLPTSLAVYGPISLVSMT